MSIKSAELRILVGFAIVAFLYFTSDVVKPLAMAIVLAFALYPIARRLEGLGLPRPVSVALTLLTLLGLIAGVGYGVSRQMGSLAAGLPEYRDNVESKLQTVIRYGASTGSATSRIGDMFHELMVKLDPSWQAPPDPSTAVPSDEAAPTKVRVIEKSPLADQVRALAGRFLEQLGVFGFVLVLVQFMLMRREDLRDRIIALFGHRHIGLTTRTMGEIGHRLTRYLASFILVNSSYGLVVGLGLSVIGVPYAVLWGFLAALLRFIPYLGPATAFALPTIFSAAYFPGWWEVAAIGMLFGLVELVLNSYLEPVVYGKTTGTSALGLLIAAMFWTWLWGLAGLFLSTPLTVCLAVVGKYVPSLRFFATLLGEEVELRPDLRFYQRIVALDRDGALAVATADLNRLPSLEVFDAMLLPALARGERDSERGVLDDEVRDLLLSVSSEVLDGLDRSFEKRPPSRGVVAGLATDPFDALALRMLGNVLGESGIELRIHMDADSPWRIQEKLVEAPFLAVVVSQFPAADPAAARYLVRRLRAQLGGTTPILIGYWRQGPSVAIRRILDAGALAVVPTIQLALERLLRVLAPTEDARSDVAPLPS